MPPLRVRFVGRANLFLYFFPPFPIAVRRERVFRKFDSLQLLPNEREIAKFPFRPIEIFAAPKLKFVGAFSMSETGAPPHKCL